MLLNHGFDHKGNDKRSTGRIGLHWAVSKGHEAVVQLLLEEGVDVHSTDKQGRTALSLAAEKGDKAMVQLLVDKGASMDSTDMDSRTPLLGEPATGRRWWRGYWSIRASRWSPKIRMV
jgi:ankyrin repeat protein